ncbi:MAG: hypothetical protein HOP28_13110 [Gemmatimonadales bacterium]|nr:hypothetical protein [Gemmatimonadales bacterium]
MGRRASEAVHRLRRDSRRLRATDPALTGRLLLSHAVAVALLAADYAARTIRLRRLVGAAGGSIGRFDALSVNAWADLGAALTPMRIGGEPARLAGLRLARVPLGASVTALAAEVATAAPITVLIGALLVQLFGVVWWRTAGATVMGGGRLYLISLVAAILVAVLAYRAGRGRRPTVPTRSAGLTWGLAATCASCAAINVACRVAILPVLVWGSGASVHLGVVTLGAFVMIFGQLLTPVPAGAGVVDAAYLAGGAGVTDVGILLAWRGYTTVFGALLGAGLAAFRFPVRAAGRWVLGGLAELLGRRRGVLGDEAIEDRAPCAAQGGPESPLGQPDS